MTFTMQKIQIILVSILIPIGLVYMYVYVDDVGFKNLFLPTVPIMHIDTLPVRVEIADTEAERVKGLSGRVSFAERDGMLFVFPEAGYHTTWMKDMYFPIDIIWIDENLEVIGIDKNITPDTYPRTFRPSRPAKYILETNVHYADTYGIKSGDEVSLPTKYIDTTEVTK